MKTLIATLALLMALSTTAAAEMSEQARCEGYASYAETIMSARQGGVSMVVIMRNSFGTMKKMVVEAYEVRRHLAPLWQDREIADFRDKWALWCFKIDTE